MISPAEGRAIGAVSKLSCLCDGVVWLKYASMVESYFSEALDEDLLPRLGGQEIMEKKIQTEEKLTEEQGPTDAAVVEAFQSMVKYQYLTQRQVARICGASTATISQFLSGKWKLNHGVVERWAKAFAEAIPEKFAEFGGPVLAWLEHTPEEEKSAIQRGRKPKAWPPVDVERMPDVGSPERKRPRIPVCSSKKSRNIDPIEAWRQEAAAFVRNTRIADPFGLSFKVKRGHVPLDDEMMMFVQEADVSLPLAVYKQAIEEVCLSQNLNHAAPQTKPERQAAALLARYAEVRSETK